MLRLLVSGALRGSNISSSISSSSAHGAHATAAAAAASLAAPATDVGSSSINIITSSSSSVQQRRLLHLAPPFLVEDYTPVGVTTHRLGRTRAKVEQAMAELKSCRACPRDCAVDRLANQAGACQVGRNAVVATVAPHYGEEQCLQGWNGSGTVFFSGCSMRCVFCQNWDIAHRPKGFEMTADELAGWMLKLQDEGQV